MSNFPQNLSTLRRRAGYTQESLAEAMGVSRQAVGKWESGQSFPEAATFLALADLLNCTLDQLMREELSDAPAQPVLAEPWGQGDEELALFETYNAHMDQFSIQMAGGVALTLGAVASLLSCCAILGGILFLLPLFVCLALAVYLFVSGGIAHSNFQKTHPGLSLRFPAEDVTAFRRTFGVGLGAAIAGILGDVALLVVLCALSPSARLVLFSVSLFMAILALCVGAIVWLGIQHGKYNGEGGSR